MTEQAEAPYEHAEPATIASSQPLALGVSHPPPVSGGGLPTRGGKVRIGDRVFAAMTSA